jgi:2-aminoadipate transaminase
MQWNKLFAERTHYLRRNTVREFLKLMGEPGMISFAGGLPAPELLPVSAIGEATQAVAARYRSEALQYGQTEGVPALRDWLAEKFSTDRVRLKRTNVLITTGAQQALDIIGRTFLDHGDQVIVEDPTYLAALSVWSPLRAQFIGIAGDEHGMDMAALENALKLRPKFVYVIPNFQNPQGTTLDLERRTRLADLLQEYHVLLIEDDPYRELRFEGAPQPTIFEMQTRLDNQGKLESNVLYVGTVSKVLAPGLRVGWICGPETVIEKLALMKQGMDLHTSTLNQYLVLEMRGWVEKHLPELRRAYRERRDAMLAALEREMPSGVSWTRPEGGMFLYLTLPEHLTAGDVLARALKEKVIFVPGADFHIKGKANTLRLNFSFNAPDVIDEGIRRLGRVMKACK